MSRVHMDSTSTAMAQFQWELSHILRVHFEPLLTILEPICLSAATTGGIASAPITPLLQCPGRIVVFLQSSRQLEQRAEMQ